MLLKIIMAAEKKHFPVVRGDDVERICVFRERGTCLALYGATRSSVQFLFQYSCCCAPPGGERQIISTISGRG
jgi:hypothetical protein